MSFSVDDPAAMMWGGELVLRDGVPAGQAMSAAWGESVGSCAGLAYVWDPEGGTVDADWIRAGRYEVNIGGERYPVSVSLKPLFDPTGEKIRT